MIQARYPISNSTSSYQELKHSLEFISRCRDMPEDLRHRYITHESPRIRLLEGPTHKSPTKIPAKHITRQNPGAANKTLWTTDNNPGIKNTVGIKGRLDAAHHINLGFGFVANQFINPKPANTMLCRNRSPHVHNNIMNNTV